MGTIVTEHPNAALVRRGYEAFNSADMATLEVRDGRMIDGREYIYDLYAWDEFWS